jgi:hypothetical protein
MISIRLSANIAIDLNSDVAIAVLFLAVILLQICDYSQNLNSALNRNKESNLKLLGLSLNSLKGF